MCVSLAIMSPRMSLPIESLNCLLLHQFTHAHHCWPDIVFVDQAASATYRFALIGSYLIRLSHLFMYA